MAVVGLWGDNPQTAAQSPPLTTLDYRVSGARLSITPAALAVPKNIAGSVATSIAGPVPDGAYIEAFLRGPSFPARRLVGVPGQPLLLPPLNLVGDYSLDGIRLADGVTDATLLDAIPATVPVQVFDEILVSRVTSRPLSLDEIEEKGIVIDQNNFRAIEFEVGFVLDGEVFPVRFPVVTPQFRQTTELIPAAELEERLAEVERINDQLAENMDLPPDLEVARPNIQIRGVNIQLTGGFKENLALSVPPIPALMIIPGNIGFLNQFFSVQIFTENAAPAASGLSVHDIKAELLLPAGPDRVPGTFEQPGDDPVRFARVGPNAEIRNIISIRAAGPDGEAGTDDDIGRLQPGQGGQGEFLVEGLQAGLHVLDLKLTAKLDGLAAGTVEVEGKAAGSVQVSNPSFSLAFSHPRTVRAGEPYDAFVTLLNTSRTIANLPSISLNKLNVSGAQLLSDERVEFRTLAPGETVTARFRFLSQRTGSISFSNITTSDDSLVGRFRLTTGIDERGVTLSRNTLTLPDEVNFLPPAVVAAANRVLGQALGTSTAPQLPPGVLRVPRSLLSVGRITTETGKFVNVGGGSMPLQLAEAGQRVRYGEPLSRVLPDLLLDWQGGRSFAEGWDQIIRSTDAGRQWREALMQAMEDADPAPDDPVSRLTFRAADLAGRGEAWVLAAVSRGVFQDDGGALTPDGSELNLLQSAGRRAGVDTSTVVKGAGYGGREGAWLVSGTPGTVQWKFGAAQPGATKLSVLDVKADGTARGIEWSVPDLPAGACALFDLTGAATELGIDDNCDGTPDRTVAGVATDFTEAPPQALIVRQDAEVRVARPEMTCYNPTTVNDLGNRVRIRNYGNIYAVLFNKPMSQESAGLASAYSLDDGTETAFVQVQPGGRVALLTLRRPVGALAPRSMRIGTGVTDLRGNAIASTDIPVQSSLVEGLAVRGRIVRPDGTGGANLPVTLTMNDGVPGSNGCVQVDVRIAQTFSDANGDFAFPFVVSGIPFSLSTTDVSSVRDNEAIAIILESSRDGAVTADRLAALGAGLTGGAENILAVNSALRRAFGVASISEAIALAEGLDRAVVSDFPPDSRQGGEGVYVLRFRGRGTVTGTVLEPDGVTPSPGAAVNLFPDPDSRELGRGVFADGAGRFTFFGVPLGGLSVEASTSSGRNRTVSALLAQAGETLDLPMVLGATIVPLTSLQGRVTEPDGAPHDGATVYVQAQAIEGVTGPTISQTITSAEGFWSIEDVPAGTVRVFAVSRDGRRKGQRLNVAAVEGAVNTVNLVLQARATVRGRVEFANGDPVAGAIVGGGEALVTTDAVGAFTVEGVPTGPNIGITAGLRADIESSDPRRRFARIGSANVNVLPGDDNFAVIRFTPAGRIAGQVLDEAGRPVPNINVAIPIFIDEDQGSFMWMPADGAGLFSFDNLGLDSYDLSAPAPPVEDFDADQAISQIRSGDRQQIEAAINAAFAAFTGASNPFLNGEGDSFNPSQWGFVRDVKLTFDGETVITAVRFLPKASISGIVKNGQNVPIGAKVRLTGIGPKPNGEPTMRVKADINSDPALGTFSFPNGTFIGDWGLQAASPFFPVVVSASGRTTQIDPVVENVLLQFPAVRETNGSLSGRVLNPDGSSAGPDIRVQISFGNDFFIRTDADGRFATPRGTFTLPASGYTVTALNEATGATGQAGAVVTAGQDNQVTVLLLGRGTAQVAVRKADNTPAPGASVELVLSGFPGGRFEGIANAQGVLEVPNLFEGAYAACASLTIGGTRVAGRTSVIVPRDGIGAGTITLGGTGTVRGQFVGTDGRTPIPFANANLSNLAVAPTDADGRFSLPDVPLGTHRLTVTDPATGRSGAVVVVLATTNEVRDVLVVETALGSVFGLVTNGPGTGPVANAEVRLTLDDSFVVNPRRTVTTGPDGRYSFAAVPAGGFELTAVDPVAGLRGSARATMPAAGGNIELNIGLQATASVTVQVFEPDGVTPANATVSMPTGSGRTSADTGTDGRVRFENVRVLAAGASPYGVDAVSLTIGQTRNVAAATVAPRVRGGEESVTLVLRGVGSLEGQVLQANGITPAPGAEVRLDMPGFSTETVVATADGRFSFANVPVGTSSLSAFSQALGAQANVTVPAHGASVTQNLTLSASGTVAGRVVRADGTTPGADADVVITFRSASNADGTFAVRLGPDGRFSFFPVTTGNFSLTASLPSVNGIAKAGGTLATNGQLVEVGDIVLDEAPPIVVSSTPAPGSDGVDINVDLHVLFSEALDPASIDGTGLFVRKSTGGPAVPATVTLVAPDGETARRLAVINPAAPLESETTYQLIVVDGDLRDALGGIINRGPRDLVGRALPVLYSATFTTRDQRPPALLSFTPENGAEQVDPRTPLRLSVDEPIQPGASLVLTGPGGPVPGTTTLGVNSLVLTFIPSADLPPNSTFTATVSGVRDVAGNEMANQPLSRTFTTLDTLGPVLSELRFKDGAAPIANAPVTLQAVLATAEAGVRIRFSVGAATLATTDTGVFELPITLPGAGALTYRAIAIDRFGNEGPLAELRVTVLENQPPVIAFEKLIPSTGATVLSASAAQIRVSVTDDGAIATFRAAGTGAWTSPLQSNSTGNPIVLSAVVPATAVPGSKIAVLASATDTAGLGSGEKRFEVEVADGTAPTLAFASPAANASVNPDAPFELDIDTADNSGAVTLEVTLSGDVAGSQSVPVTGAPNAAQRSRLSFDLSAAPRTGGAFTATARATDAAGRITIATRSFVLPDVVPPALTLIDPADGSTGASVTSTVLARFSEPLDPATVTQDSVRLTTNGTPVPGSVTLTNSGRDIRFSPAGFLVRDSVYTFALTSAIRGTDGNAIAPVSSSFTVTIDFRITAPVAGTAVIEGQPVAFASGPADAGFDGVVYSAAGRDLAAGSAPTFAATVTIPLLAELGAPPHLFGGRAFIDSLAGTNLALGKAANQSSNGFGAPASRAVDGNRDGNFNAGSVTHTNGDLHAWWDVDLGSVEDISLIRIFWRTDCCAERNRVAVLLADTPFDNADFTGSSLPAVYANGAREVYRTTAAFDQNRTSVFTTGRARFLRIAHLETNFLHLAEVEVLGAIDGLPLAPVALDVRPGSGDEDGDGLTNADELANGLDPFADDASLDPDTDGLTNAEEIANGTNPRLADTDTDGLNDGQELAAGTNPRLPDTDADGLRDGLEITLGTSPLLPDTDGDTLPDGVEVGVGRISFVNDSPRSWLAARADAESRGGHLLTLASAAENTAFLALFGSDPRLAGAAIGHTDRFIEGAFRTVTGEVTSLANFAPGEPNNANNEDAVQLRSDGRWNDVSESASLPAYVLETGFYSNPLVRDTDGDGLEDAVDPFTGQPNRAPLAVADSVVVDPGSSVVLSITDLLSDDSDPDGDPIVLTGIGAPAHGTAIFENNGTQIRYTPEIGYSGPDSFTYDLVDAGGLTAEGTVAVTVGTNHPPLAGGPVIYDNRGLRLDGTDDSATGPLLPAITDSFTMELWVKPNRARAASNETNTGASGQFVGQFAIFPTHGTNSLGGDPHAGAGLSVGTNGFVVVEHAAGYFPTPVVFDTPVTDWTHVAVVYENKQPRLFVNGLLVRTGLVSPRIVHPSTEISTALGRYEGLIDEFRVWNHARSNDAIAADFARRLDGSESGLTVYWRMDEAAGLTLVGDEPAGRNGTLAGGTARVSPGAPLLTRGQNFRVAQDVITPLALTGSDEDGQPLTARLVSLPAQGRLFQAAPNGTPGAEITTVPASVISGARVVFYQPDPGFTGDDWFSFTVNDGIDDSGPGLALVTVGPVLAPAVDDLWDVSAGTTVTATSGLRPDSSAPAIFGGGGGAEPGIGIFADGQAAGFTHFLEWQTAGFVRLEGANVFAANDPATGQRGFTEMRLYGRLDPGDPFTLLQSLRPGANPYFPGPSLAATVAFTPFIGSQFRAEFDQFGTPATGGPRIVELDALGESIVFTPINNGLPIPLQNATADRSQGGFSPAAVIDGNLAAGSGWAGDVGGTPPMTAVFETVTDAVVTAEDEFLFNLIQLFGGQHFIGNFRLSATTDNRADFADGLINGGDITANWTVLDVTSAVSTGGETITLLPDNSVLIGGTMPSTTTYTVRAKGIAGNVTGLRLELLEHPSLPNNGPGRVGHGNWVLNEFTVATAALAPNRAPQSSPDIAQTPQGFPVTSGNVLANDTDPEGDPISVFDFTQPASGTGSVVSNGNGTFTYTPPDGSFTGEAVFTYRATDGNQPGRPATVTVTVNPTSIVAWNNAAGGAWTTASNWTPARVPGPEDRAVISLPGTYVVTLSTGTQTPLAIDVGGDGATVTLRQTAGVLSPQQASSVRSGSTYELAGGTLAGTSTLTVNGVLAWTGGSMRDAGKTLIAPGAIATISGGSNKDLSANRILENAGTLTASGGTVFFNIGNLGGGAVINNLAGATFEAQGETDFSHNFATVSAFNNAGLFRKTGGGTTSFSNSLVAFNNSGTVEIISGSLQLNGGGTHSGTLTSEPTGTLELGGSTFTSGPTAAVTLQGPLTVSGGTTTFAGPVSALGTITAAGGSLAFNGPLTNGDSLVIGNGSIAFNQNQSFATFAQSNGVLGGTGTVTVTSSFSWTGGSMRDTGKTLIAPGAIATISGGSNKDLSANRILENAGTLTASGGTVFFNINNLGGGAVINNLAGATFEVQGETDFSHNFATVSAFNNTGLFRKTGGGTTSFSNSLVAFNNSGTVEIVSGRLFIDGGGTNVGTLTSEPTGTFELGGNTFTSGPAATVTLQGPLASSGGTTTFAGPVSALGTITAAGGSLAFNGPLTNGDSLVIGNGSIAFNQNQSFATFAQSNGVLGGTGTVTVTSSFSWTGGSMRDAGKTRIAPGAIATLSGGSNKDLSANRILENAGTLTASGGTVFFNINNLGGGAVINNLAGATFEVQGETDFSHNFATVSAFNNSGLFRKTGGGTTSFSSSLVAFNNTGTVEIVSGTLLFDGGGSLGGLIDVQSGGSLNLAGGTFTAPDGAAITGPGTVLLTGGGASFNGELSVGTRLTISSGTWTFNANQSFTHYSQSGGALAGTGTVTVTESFSWTGGTMRDAGKTLIAPGATATISGGSNKDLSANRILENASTLTVSGGTVFFNLNNFGGGAVINNLAGAILEVQGETDFSNNFASPGSSVNNAGLFRKTGPGETRFDNSAIAFNNTGTVEITGGSLGIEAASTNNGRIEVAAGAVFAMKSGTVTTGPAAEHAGDGTFSLQGATLTLSEPATFPNLAFTTGTLRGTATVTATNTLSWTGGTMRDDGKTLIAPGATATISGGNNKDLSANRILENAGTLTVSGGTVFFNLNNLGGGAVINNLTGATMEVQGETDFLDNFATVSSVNNAGLFRKTGPGETRFGNNAIAFNNTGTVEITGGSLGIEAASTNNGRIEVAAGAVFAMKSGTVTTGPAAEHAGDGTFSLQGATLTLSEPATFPNLAFTTGTLRGTATVTATNTFSWTGGIMRDAGKTLISSGATATISGGNNKDLSANRILENAGTLTVSGGTVFFNLGNLGGGAVINNLAGATLEVQGETDFTDNFTSISSVTNAGLLRKTGPGETRFGADAVALVNTGTIEITGGSLRPQAAFTQNGTVRGSGIIVGNVTNNGTFQPDPVPGGLIVQGNYTQTADGRLDLRLAGFDPLLQHRGLRITGTATLNGALDIALEPPFAEPLAATFPVISFASRSGSFSSTSGLSDNFGYAFSSSFTATSLDLAVTTQGEVPAPAPTAALASLTTDFTHWIQRQSGATGNPHSLTPLDDPDGDGAANVLEYAFGTGPFDAASVFTPVPGTLVEDDRTWATLEFRRRTDSATLAYEVLESPDLVRWAQVADVRELSREPVPGQPGLETVRLAIWPPLVVNEPCFLGIRVSEVKE